MNQRLRDALDRTLLLMRDALIDAAPDDFLLAALTDTNVALVADAENLASHAAQSAYVTAALTMARSGHRVHLVAPDVPLVGPQPPLKPGSLIYSLLEVGREILPGIEFSSAPPKEGVDLEVRLGDSLSRSRAKRVISIASTSWLASLRSSGPCARWGAVQWPLGGMAAGVLASVEAFKTAMHKLRTYAKNAQNFDAELAFVGIVDLELAPADAPIPNHLGSFDLVSGGAIVNALLFALARILNVVGTGRILDPDVTELSNLNRYALLLQGMLGRQKAMMLESMSLPGLRLKGVPQRFSGESLLCIQPLAPSVLVGADDIRTRWGAQSASPRWLGIAGTTHQSCLVSFHEDGLGCARCLHATDDRNAAPIPTAAFVSFWAGLLLATYFVRAVTEEPIPLDRQSVYFTTLRPETLWYAPVARRLDCPNCGHSFVGSSSATRSRRHS